MNRKADMTSAFRTRFTLLLVACVATLTLGASPAAAAPVLDVKTKWGPTHLVPGDVGQFVVNVRNYGDTNASGPVTVELTLPPGVTRVPPAPFDDFASNGEGAPYWSCSDLVSGGIDTVTCTNSMEDIVARTGAMSTLEYWDLRALVIRVAVAPDAAGTHEVTTEVSSGGGSDSSVQPITIDDDPTSFGVVDETFRSDLFDAAFPAGQPIRHAGAHPFELRVGFDFNLRKAESPSPLPGFVSTLLSTQPVEDARTTVITLPHGLAGNPEATPKCSSSDFLRKRGNIDTGCPPETQVGTLDLYMNAPPAPTFNNNWTTRVGVYNLEPRKGVPADFGFNVLGYRGHIYPTLDPARNYAIKATTPYISSILPLHTAEFTMWGVPADPAHFWKRTNENEDEPLHGIESNAPIKPLLSLPMDCSDHGRATFGADSWQSPGWDNLNEDPTGLPVYETSSAESLEVEGCDDPRIRFEPKVALQPTSRAAGGPTGLKVDLIVPQRNDTVGDADELYEQNGDVQAIPTPPMKKAVVTFPEGMTLSTSAAQGLGNCTAEQIGMGTNSPVRCPEDSRYGSLTLHTPILPPDAPMVGDIYIAKQNENPFNNFLSMYFVIHDDDRGLLVKIAGRIDLDPRTGQIRTTFDDLPQFPVSNMELTFKGGVRAGLVNPTTCGTKTIRAEFFSWHDPDTPITETNSYDVTRRPDGSPCVNSLSERPFGPKLTAGTVNPSAGAYSPFTFRLQRTDDDQEFSQLGVTLPPGLLANISKIAECPEAGIAQAEASGRTGTQEQAAPSCPASSQIGTTDVGSGVGQVITYIPGKAYLAGPYKGAPLSMVVITPVLAGPYDLGVIAVRSAIHVDPQTAQASIQTDPFPQIYQGIPVRIRDIRVKADRPDTIVNPTSCDPMAVEARVTGTGGILESIADDTAVDLAERFQAANCARLGFKPKLSFKLRGGTERGDFPALEATLRARPGDANIARSTVILPRSEFIEQGHIRTVCTRVQFAADQCPPGSIYGRAKATSPLFDEVLEGPVYLRSNGGERLLPDLVVSLDGKIEVALAGFIDSVKGRVRNTFDVVPDAPVTMFKLMMQGGKKGLLVNHLDLCEVTARADVKFVGQNGKIAQSRPKMGTSCKGKGRKGRKG